MKFEADAILEFWYADDALSPEGYETRNQQWFTPNDEFDEEIRNRFEPQIVLAANLCNSGLSTDVRQNLARIIATDQFPRNVYRGTPQAFAYDSAALQSTKAMIENGMHEDLSFAERVFAYMPLQHSERIEVQQLSVQMFELLRESADHPVFLESAAQSVDYAELHREIIERFGRFPHRNEILGRKSTPEEIAYLESGAETFGQMKK